MKTSQVTINTSSDHLPQRVVDLVEKLQAKFHGSSQPAVMVNVFVLNGFDQSGKSTRDEAESQINDEPFDLAQALQELGFEEGSIRPVELD